MVLVALLTMVVPGSAHDLELSTFRLRWVNERLLVGEVIVDAAVSLRAGEGSGKPDPTNLDTVVDSPRGRRLIEHLSRGLILLADGAPASLRFTPLVFGDPAREGRAGTDTAEVHVRLESMASGEQASGLVLKPTRAFGDALFVVEDDDGETQQVVVRGGESSVPFRIEEGKFADAADTAGPQRDAAAGAPGFEQSSGSVLAQYLRLGFEHILPKGLDHVLFVLGLCLVPIRLWRLVAHLTLFTLAHSVTLAVSALHLWRLSPSVVEPLIGVSITLIAGENLLMYRHAKPKLTRQLHHARGLTVFAFGLVHGSGFAGVLNELGIPETQMLPALAGFNLGVELGQLTVVGLAALGLRRLWITGAWTRDRSKPAAAPDDRTRVSPRLQRLAVILNAVIGVWGLGLALSRATA